MLFVNYVSSGASGDADPKSGVFNIFFQDGETFIDIPITHITSVVLEFHAECVQSNRPA